MAMREIKFRGKCTPEFPHPTVKWVYGSLVSDSKKKKKTALICVHLPVPTRDGNTFWYEVYADTVGQYTGLRDSDGREIYEGDIVRVVHYGDESIHTVKYCDDMDYPAFDLWPNFDCECNGLSFCKCENETTVTVIGNVYDNPELIIK